MLMDLLFEGVIKGLETVCDVLEYGPVEAVKINTSVIPQAERDYRKIMANIDKPSSTSSFSGNDEKKSHLLKAEENTDVKTERKLTDDNLEKFSALIEDIKANFSVESNNIDLELIYDYYRLNAYGKVILDKISSNKSNGPVDLSTEERLKMGFLFKERCRKGECDKYSFIFWALMVLTVDDTDKEERLSQICDFSRFLEINEEEMMNITRLICAICKNK
ncbi:MAG: hypothetical protein HFI51_13710 [Lachnospiraceae bacterium]|jgi:hypothetical protein|nr:hypothetical protein [Lachnospiraceae bacterium]